MASPYGGLILAALAAVGGTLESQAPVASATEAAASAIVLAADQTIVIDQVKAVCARRDAEIISAAADPASGTSLHLALVDGTGDFIADVPIMISGRNLKGPEMRLRCRGDWLMLKMMPGDYTVTAEADGLVRTRQVAVPEFGRIRATLSVRDTRLAAAS